MRVTIHKNMAAYRRLEKMNNALILDNADMAGPVLTELGQLHRKQELALFASQGATGATGRWTPNTTNYAARKKKVFGNRKQLVLTGNTKRRFTVASNPGYIQRFVPRGTNGAGVFEFGANSEVGLAHYWGAPGQAEGLSTVESRHIFGGTARRLPVRDMISKTPKDIYLMLYKFAQWYNNKRIPQVLRRFKGRITDS